MFSLKSSEKLRKIQRKYLRWHFFSKVHQAKIDMSAAFFRILTDFSGYFRKHLWAASCKNFEEVFCKVYQQFSKFILVVYPYIKLLWVPYHLYQLLVLINSLRFFDQNLLLWIEAYLEPKHLWWNICQTSMAERFPEMRCTGSLS